MGARARVREEVEAVVERAMARRPDERFATASDLADALEALRDRGDHSKNDRRSRPLPPARSHAVPRERVATLLVSSLACAGSAASVSAVVHLGARGAGADSERALALALALVVVGATAAGLGVGVRLGREVAARFRSATELRVLRERVLRSLLLGTSVLGASELALAASDVTDPWAELGATVTACVAAGLAWAWRDGSVSRAAERSDPHPTDH